MFFVRKKGKTSDLPKFASQQWRSDAKGRPGPTIKVPPFPPLKSAYKILKCKKIMFRGYIRINKAS